MVPSKIVITFPLHLYVAMASALQAVRDRARHSTDIQTAGKLPVYMEAAKIGRAIEHQVKQRQELMEFTARYTFQTACMLLLVIEELCQSDADKDLLRIRALLKTPLIKKREDTL